MKRDRNPYEREISASAQTEPCFALHLWAIFVRASIYKKRLGIRAVIWTQIYHRPCREVCPLQDVILALIEMSTIHSFNIEPITRFAGFNAGIRRPKVHSYPNATGDTLLMRIHRRSPVSLTMTSISFAWMLRPFATTILRACLQI